MALQMQSPGYKAGNILSSHYIPAIGSWLNKSTYIFGFIFDSINDDKQMIKK